MNSFELMVVNGVEYQGEGYYERNSTGMVIDSASSVIKKELKRLIKNRIIIKSIEFKIGESDVAFTGNFFVTDVNGTLISLMKV